MSEQIQVLEVIGIISMFTVVMCPLLCWVLPVRETYGMTMKKERNQGFAY